MPEGDTVWRTARRLDEALAGQPILGCDLRWPDLATVDVRGTRTLAVVSAGKHVLHRLDSGLTIHSHLRMEGQWRIVATEAMTARTARRPDLRAILTGPAWTALGLRLGRLGVLATADEARVVGHLGPDVLGAGWDPAEAARRIRSASGTLGGTLLDQSVLAGVGTMYAAEALFLRRLGPWRAAAELDPDDAAGLVSLLHRLLDGNRQHAVQSTTGSRRQGSTTWVHARVGLPCRRCGETIRLAHIGPPEATRVFFYCPRCQGGLAPDDDGRPQRPLGAAGAGMRGSDGPVRRQTPRRRRGGPPGG